MLYSESDSKRKSWRSWSSNTCAVDRLIVDEEKLFSFIMKNAYRLNLRKGNVALIPILGKDPAIFNKYISKSADVDQTRLNILDRTVLTKHVNFKPVSIYLVNFIFLHSPTSPPLTLPKWPVCAVRRDCRIKEK